MQKQREVAYRIFNDYHDEFGEIVYCLESKQGSALAYKKQITALKNLATALLGLSFGEPFFIGIDDEYDDEFKVVFEPALFIFVFLYTIKIKSYFFLFEGHKYGNVLAEKCKNICAEIKKEERTLVQETPYTMARDLYRQHSAGVLALYLESKKKKNFFDIRDADDFSSIYRLYAFVCGSKFYPSDEYRGKAREKVVTEFLKKAKDDDKNEMLRKFNLRLEDQKLLLAELLKLLSFFPTPLILIVIDYLPLFTYAHPKMKRAYSKEQQQEAQRLLCDIKLPIVSLVDYFWPDESYRGIGDNFIMRELIDLQAAIFSIAVNRIWFFRKMGNNKCSPDDISNSSVYVSTYMDTFNKDTKPLITTSASLLKDESVLAHLDVIEKALKEIKHINQPPNSELTTSQEVSTVFNPYDANSIPHFAFFKTLFYSKKEIVGVKRALSRWTFNSEMHRLLEAKKITNFYQVLEYAHKNPHSSTAELLKEKFNIGSENMDPEKYYPSITNNK